MSESSHENINSNASSIKYALDELRREIESNSKTIIKQKEELQFFKEEIKHNENINMKDELNIIYNKSTNQRKIIDLLVDESHDLNDENNFLYQKIIKGNEVKESLLLYSNQLKDKKNKLINEISNLKQKQQIEQSLKEETNKDDKIKSQLLLDEENRLNEKKESIIDLKSKIEGLVYQISKNKEIIKNEEMYNQKINDKQVYLNEYCNFHQNTTMILDNKIKCLKDNLNSLQIEINKNSLDYLNLNNNLEKLQKSISKINQNNYQLFVNFEDSLLNLNNNVRKLNSENESLESSSHIKYKILNSLKEIDSLNKNIDKYLDN